MSHLIGRPDVTQELSSLKDFQLETVEHVFRRMYLDAQPARRFLVADEVGLGKTLVARGVIGKAIEHLWDTVPRIDIIYICSNADIARQNIRRLQLEVPQSGEFVSASRITLLPTQLKSLKNNRVNFVSFTPTTSFELKSSLGIADERVLLYWMLEALWGVDRAGASHLLQGNAGFDAFQVRIDNFHELNGGKEHAISSELQTQFGAALAKQPDLRTRFEELADELRDRRRRMTAERAEQRGAIVGELRLILARVCLNALEPDLILLDEFQRFKHLLQGSNDAGDLARQLFDYSDDDSQARVLLLSATPYKMYTLAEEGGDDNHYQDFLDTLGFLGGDDGVAATKQAIEDYRKEIYRLGRNKDTALGELRTIKARLEDSLAKVMVRTERLAVTSDRDGMLQHIQSQDVSLDPVDLRSYVELAGLSKLIEGGDVLTYWKAAPYLLNFMDEYDLKRAFGRACKNPEVSTEIAARLASPKAPLLDWEQVRSYSKVDPGNARLRSLFADVIDGGSWKMLWLPPSLPYYGLEGPFAGDAARTFTKRLIFSAWRVVPKVIASLGSYEVERRMMVSDDATEGAASGPALENTAEARRTRGNLLRFRRADGRLAAMPVLGWIYPSRVLAKSCDPLAFAAGRAELPSLDEVVTWAAEQLDRLLDPIVAETPTEGPEDEQWYWAAPILLDKAAYPDATRAWFDQPDLAARWSGQNEEGHLADDEVDVTSAWEGHVNRARDLVAGRLDLGRVPADLSRVLAELAIGGPATCALRTLQRINNRAGDPAFDGIVAIGSARIAWAFPPLFNLPETTALIRRLDNREPYWRRVLEYCCCGGLQAVLDEYAHVLLESEALLGKPVPVMVQVLVEKIVEAMAVRASNLGVDVISARKGTPGVDVQRHGLRARFAMRFQPDPRDAANETTRPAQVRAAFNSPFWPFVLATTSVGQEGLDFHPYAHAVVHWDLPSNPVDLEQREGRVHRYKGHAVRKNLAARFGLASIVASKKLVTDPWRRLFIDAKGERDEGASDLVPFWVYPLEGGARIERHVPALPLSRESEALETLRRSLAMYRMVFGQPRQDDLVAYLMEHMPAEDVPRVAEELRLNLGPARNSPSNR